MSTVQRRRNGLSLRIGVVAGSIALVIAAGTTVSAPASAATSLSCPHPSRPAPTAAQRTYPTADREATVTLDGAAVTTFAGITIPQAVVNDPVTGNAFVAYYTPGDYPDPAVAEVTATGRVVSQSVLKDGAGGDSLALYRIGTIDDSHNSLAIALDKKGFVHVAGDMRPYRPMGYWRSAAPHTVASMLYKSNLPGLVYNAHGVSLFATDAERTSSAPKFFRPADGELYFGFNHYVSGQGDFYLLHYNPDTFAWDNVAGGHDMTYGFVNQVTPLLNGYNDSKSPYVQPIVTGPHGWYWLTWSWRDDAANVDTTGRIQVMKTRDFHHWYTAGGAALPSSIKYSWEDTATNVPAGFEVGSLPISGAGFVNNNNYLGFASDGDPVMVYFRADQGKTNIHIDRLGSRGTWVSGTPIPMTGYYDVKNALNVDTLSIDGPPTAVRGSSDVIVRYLCRSAALEARVGLGALRTYSTLVGYDYQRASSVPQSATTLYPESAGFVVAPRTAVSDPFTAADGTTRVWAIKWDAGPYVSSGAKPTWAYPKSGSRMTLYSYRWAG